MLFEPLSLSFSDFASAPGNTETFRRWVPGIWECNPYLSSWKPSFCSTASMDKNVTDQGILRSLISFNATRNSHSGQSQNSHHLRRTNGADSEPMHLLQTADLVESLSIHLPSLLEVDL